MAEQEIEIEVAYAKPDEQVIISLKMPVGITAGEAIMASGLLVRYPEIDLEVNKIGIFSRICGLDQVLQPADRVEIYRPLLNDPKEARRQRAAKS
ncbi:MAG: RnfH family protein [Methylococcaceae bacterium]|jgi:hypothetical protein